MKQYKIVFSSGIPSMRDAIWAKPEGNGFTLSLLDGGVWKPLKLNEDNVPVPKEDITTKVIGSVQDKKSANTINGAKAFAKDVRDKIIGSSRDSATDLTLYGLKAYIDSKLSKLK